MHLGGSNGGVFGGLALVWLLKLPDEVSCRLFDGLLPDRYDLLKDEPLHLRFQQLVNMEVSPYRQDANHFEAHLLVSRLHLLRVSLAALRGRSQVGLERSRLPELFLQIEGFHECLVLVLL